MWLPVPIALMMASACALLAMALRRARSTAKWTPFAVETAVVLVLYSLWLKAGELEVGVDTAAGFERGRTIWRVSKWVPLPSELWLNQQVAARSWLAQASNIHYAVAHIPAMIALLIWLFVRHRHAYAPWRNTLALLTGLCLLIRLVPVAPPRLMPEYGFIDTAIVHGQSVYGPVGSGVSAQLAAMPSVHVGWAVMVGWVAWRVSTSRWRWIAVVHAVITSVAVVVTASHWWLDGIVAAAFIPPCWWVQHLAVRAVRNLKQPSARPMM
jgi:PAP2 superfamily